MFFKRKPLEIPSAESALPGRDTPIPTAEKHFVNASPLKGPYPEGAQQAMFGLGCFWGAERIFWQLPGVYLTAVGYSAGYTPNPTYKEVCSGQTGHNEVVLVVFDPKTIGFADLVAKFFESHDPTQVMRQGNDVGTQYRSGIYTFSDDQKATALEVKQRYQEALSARGMGAIATEIVPAKEFYFAEDYHQQYLAKNPRGYCGLGGTGISCPRPELAQATPAAD